MGRLNITLISASAGSGKTYHLTEELAKALEKGARPEGILATTFTNKAAAEITERVRLRLLENGKWDEAQRVLDGYIGTVNSICGRILKDFAFEAGLSPALDVLPSGDDQLIYNRAIYKVVEEYAPKLEPLARRLQLGDWREQVKKVIDLGRANGIAPNELEKSSVRSLSSLFALLPEPGPKGAESAQTEIGAKKWDPPLEKAIAEALKNLEGGTDTTKATQSVIDSLRKCHRKIQDRDLLTWSEWAGLSRLEPGAKSRDTVAPVKEAAAAHLTHPRFRKDLEDCVEGIFACAAEAMEAYALYKERHGLIDFVDQESLCLRVLQKPEVRKKLAERLDLVLVDEFQDTSPIQLAIFLQLAGIAPGSVWVGDQKQAIYGFRGTDSTMMDAVIDSLIAPAMFEILECSYRSRPDLVAFTSALFAGAFAPLGIGRDRVALEAKRSDGKGQAGALHVWQLMASNADQEARALATGVGDLLLKSTTFQVHDKTARDCRPLRGGDIAILCRSNSHCGKVAAVLEEFGIRAALPRKNLLSQPECVLALAAFRYLVSPYDSLAAAEIVHMTEDGSKPGEWFFRWMSSLEEGAKEPWKAHACIKELDSRRDCLLRTTPTEALELALRSADVERKIFAWGDGAQRLANIEMIRELARQYEERCQVQRRAGTPAGLVTFLSEEVEGGELDTQAQGRDENAVQVLTYHRAKGLEWPLVILSDLQAVERADPFGAHVHPCDKPFDPHNPLMGRWVRYWPWPYGDRGAVGKFEEAISASKEKRLVQLANRKEMMRLLYVGMTRARDYLVLAPREKCRGVSPTEWLEALTDEQGKVLMALPKEAGEKEVRVAGKLLRMIVSQFHPTGRQADREEEPVYLASPGAEKGEFLPAQLIPSRLSVVVDENSLDIDLFRLGDRIPLKGDPDMTVLGEAIHSFLAVDDRTVSREHRLAVAEKILSRWGTEEIEPAALLTASDRLWNHLHKVYGTDCLCRREWPVHLRVGEQKAEGWIDLLVATPAGYVIIDHKSFPGKFDECCSRAKDYAPQLTLYKQAVEKATKKPVIDTLIHMPVTGFLIRVKGL